MPGFGTFEDGALNDNNPTAMALRSLGPGRNAKPFVLSIGTGFQKADVTPDSQSPRKWLDHALLRLLRSWDRSLSGRRRVLDDEFSCGATHYERLDLEFVRQVTAASEY